jgi:hypothetical protein
MPKTKISEFSATPANNTDIDSINIAEGCAPSGINDAIRELMAQLKDFQTGAVGDSFNGPIGTSTAAAGAFTTLSASSTVSGTGFSTYLASPPAIGGTAAGTGAFTSLTASTTLGVTGVSTLTGGAVVQGMTVGRGAGSVVSNTVVGNGALPVNTSGTESTAVGYQAMYQTTGGTNTSVGAYAGYSTTTGTGNTSVGYGAGHNIGGGTGTDNTFIGKQSGSQTNTGSKNVIIGSYSGAAALSPINGSGSNFVVLSDGDGNVVSSVKTAQTFALQGAIPNSGTGITFPATQSASSNANTLDDYEEGTWTPNQGSGLTVIGTFSSSGKYTKIGRVVTLAGAVSASTSLVLANGGQLCTNIPFAQDNDPYPVVSTISSENQIGGAFILTSTILGSSAIGTPASNIKFSVTYYV